MTFARAGRGAAESWWCPSAVRAPAGMAKPLLDEVHVHPPVLRAFRPHSPCGTGLMALEASLLTRMASLPQSGRPPSPRSRHGVAVEARLSRSGGQADEAPTSCDGKRPCQAHHAEMDRFPSRSSWKPQESGQQDHPLASPGLGRPSTSSARGVRGAFDVPCGAPVGRQLRRFCRFMVPLSHDETEKTPDDCGVRQRMFDRDDGSSALGESTPCTGKWRLSLFDRCRSILGSSDREGHAAPPATVVSDYL